jgi:hypothetical protein
LNSIAKDKRKEEFNKNKQYILEISKLSTNYYKENYEFNLGLIDKIDLININIEKINKETFINENFSKVILINNIIQNSRYLFHNALYYLENNSEDKAINMILNNYKL